MTIPFLPVDFVILAVLGLSGFFAAYRGFVNEFLAILGWGLAAIITAVLFGSVKGTVREMVDPDWFADTIGMVGLFLAVIIPISFIAFRIGEAARQSSIGPLDRSMGFVYGVVRGLLIAAIAYMIFAALVPANAQPAWIKDAKLIPIVQRSGDVLTSLFYGKQPKGVPVSAPPPDQRPVKPQPQPEHERLAAIPPPVQVFAPRPPPPPAPAEPVRPDLIPPASEVGVLAPPPAPPPIVKERSVRPPASPRPKPQYRTVAMDESGLAARTNRPEKPKKPEAAPRPRAKATDANAKKPPAKSAAKPATAKSPPKKQAARVERRPAANGSGDKGKRTGYGHRDRQALDQLVRSSAQEP